ncbi:uncharacterized protein N7459_002990 [Penicillium hispanicum]|uniref:uncharacterized protein n=1 Tax=Penicillium hispanicum TaxID=1080232 RepID=UPI002541CB02|nr:uncharacterized protein N7459_002990 [Penicillium hispanicum]KAJ5587225.1 hypothetical protein N7459_002990 [Penicillium hispanicum]
MSESDTDDITSPIQSVVAEFGHRPLAGTSLDDRMSLEATPETVLAMVMDAMVKSRPISHDLSQRTMSRLIEEGYHEIDTLSRSTWEERTAVLREGGYNRYREQCATNLGDLGELVNIKYDGDLNNMLKDAQGERGEIRSAMKEIRGVGDLAVELFFNNVQSIWPSVAPFVDPRSLKTAEEIGIGTDLDAIYGALHREPEQMSLLANGLSEVRLEKKQKAIHH